MIILSFKTKKDKEHLLEKAKKMEEYANYGFDYIHEKLEEDSNWLSRNSSLLDTFLSFTIEKEKKMAVSDNDEPDDI